MLVVCSVLIVVGVMVGGESGLVVVVCVWVGRGEEVKR